ncbi:ABC-type nitrate/sulfonate/bicarbonate transport system substrate-binding protein [Catalinimonas alkaloidigena]|uniref:ABC transporter substrate-binding protein n=1 Tax=Catalinimonas alkaloidigena TaxID=1075417 RepID=UPI0024056C0B|nr:ABC transporter substrate-binding protein [Catalinimonas alkaloidigena]MDF9794773.1 ABC-type nitrate/sulfonate/bicarbonate transport system substrate-binding protein [Catalinimonas alkaloidigena]
MKLKIALDWTPNVIHAGMYLAQLENIFAEHGLEVELISTDVDNYTKKPIERLIEGEVDIALGPSEHLINYRLLKEESFPVKAIATVMQEETSAFVTLKSSGIDRPAKLDGKTYAGYKTVLEENLITTIIRNDGGKGEIELTTPPRLSVFDGFLQRKADTCWVFMPWEGIIAQQKGYELNAFHLKDYQVPYGYSPILMTLESTLKEKGAALQHLLQACGQGYIRAASEPEKAAAFLVQGIAHSNFEDISFIMRAMQVIAPTFLNQNDRWGVMSNERWNDYTRWLIKHKMLKKADGIVLEEADTESFFTNTLLD